jgi:hypothetical protein
LLALVLFVVLASFCGRCMFSIFKKNPLKINVVNLKHGLI